MGKKSENHFHVLRKNLGTIRSDVLFLDTRATPLLLTISKTPLLVILIRLGRRFDLRAEPQSTTNRRPAPCKIVPQLHLLSFSLETKS